MTHCFNLASYLIGDNLGCEADQYMNFIVSFKWTIFFNLAISSKFGLESWTLDHRNIFFPRDGRTSIYLSKRKIY